MANIKKITSFTGHETAEGKRLSYTFSEIDESGNLIKANERATCIILDPEVEEAYNKINKFLLDRESATV